MSHEEDLKDFVYKIEEFIHFHYPKWLTPNSTSVGVLPGHNLDLMQISFDFRIDRTDLLLSDTPDVLKDFSKADLQLHQGGSPSES